MGPHRAQKGRNPPGRRRCQYVLRLCGSEPHSSMAISQRRRVQHVAHCECSVLYMTPQPLKYFSQNDFPFFIRIPESIPPTIALEKGGEPSSFACPCGLPLQSNMAGQVAGFCNTRWKRRICPALPSVIVSPGEFSRRRKVARLTGQRHSRIHNASRETRESRVGHCADHEVDSWHQI